MAKKDLGRKTPFYDKHRQHGAQLVNFFGFAMPLQYVSMVAEHRRVRSTVGMFDLSHMGEIEIRGPDALDFVQKMTINDASLLQIGQAQYTAMCYRDGGIVDDFLAYRLRGSYLLVVNAANISKVFQWLMDNREGQIEIENLSDARALLAVQGPRAEDVMVKLVDIDLKGISYYRFVQDQVAGCDMLISRTGYTGEDGFELYFNPGYADHIWETFLKAGQEFQIEPVGLAARDSLRLEMKFLLYGQDIDETTNPLEAGLSWVAKLDKGDFIGRGALLALKKQGLTRKLVAFEMLQRAIPRSHYPLCVAGQRVGQVTSGLFSPSLNKGIGTGYVSIEHAAMGTRLDVLIRGTAVPAQVVKPPFYKEGSRK